MFAPTRVLAAHLSTGNLPAGVALILLWALLQTATMLWHEPPILDGYLFGTDSYMRLVRVADLVDSRDWFDRTIERSNAPFGELLHWTRPLDVVLLLFALILTTFLEFSDALFWAGAVISPAFQLAAVLGLIWAVAPIMRTDRWLIPGAALLPQPAVFSYGMVGRADHHSLLMLLFVIALGYTLRAIGDRQDRRSAFLAGTVLGVGLWVSTEMLIAAVAFGASLALAWLLSNSGRARQNGDFAIGFLIVVTLGVAAEWPIDEILTVAYDRISCVHWSVAALLAVFWQMAVSVEARLGHPTTQRSRVTVIGLYGLAASAIVYSVFPQILAGPLADVDPRTVPIWIGQVGEMRAILPTSPTGVAEFVKFFGLAFAAVPFLGFILISERWRPPWSGWCAIAIAIELYWPIAMMHARLSIYAEILFIVIIAELLSRLTAWTRQNETLLLGAVTRSAAIATALIGTQLLATLIAPGAASRSAIEAEPTHCDISAVAAYLDRDAAWSAGPRLTILAFLDHGPELLYRTRHSVIGTPYHRNNDGIVDTYRALAARDDIEARALMRKRNVDLVLVCPMAPERRFFRGQDGEPVLYDRLRAGNAPRWLDAIELPAPIADHFKLYRPRDARDSARSR